jgi:hypothetical protein
MKFPYAIRQALNQIATGLENDRDLARFLNAAFPPEHRRDPGQEVGAGRQSLSDDRIANSAGIFV